MGNNFGMTSSTVYSSVKHSDTLVKFKLLLALKDMHTRSSHFHFSLYYKILDEITDSLLPELAERNVPPSEATLVRKIVEACFEHKGLESCQVFSDIVLSLKLSHDYHAWCNYSGELSFEDAVLLLMAHNLVDSDRYTASAHQKQNDCQRNQYCQRVRSIFVVGASGTEQSFICTSAP
jgi:hypothetical protein